MKKIVYTILTFLLISCQIEKEDSYKFIEKEIKEYRNLINFKTLYYFKREDEMNRKKMNNLHQEIFDIYNETSFFLKASKNEPPIDIIKRLDKFYNERSENCYNKIGTLKNVKLSDTMYFHKIKFNYIKCVLKNSEYYDSIPELKRRINGW